jgi:hypothetical protein
MSVRLIVVPASLALAVAAASPPAGKTEISGGVGSGTYAHPYGCSGMVRVPYREVGVGVRHEESDGLVGGFEASARDDEENGLRVVVVDDEAAPPEVRAGARFRLSPWVGYHGSWFRGSLGMVATDYLSPMRDEDGVKLFPRGTLGLGPPSMHVDLGVLDTPNALASAGDGGAGILSLRVGSDFGPDRRHRLAVGVGAAQGAGYGAASLTTRFDNDLMLGAGGYLGEHRSYGAFVTAGMAFWR